MVDHKYVAKTGAVLLFVLIVSVYLRKVWLDNSLSGFASPRKGEPIHISVHDPIMKKLQSYQRRREAAKPPVVPHYDNKFHVLPSFEKDVQ
jgi:hypothetical protein